MNATYDPRDPRYLDEAAVRDEMTRVFDVCQGCRRCVELCTSFPTLFDMLDQFDDRDAGRLTPAQQDEIVGRCFQCTLCRLDCPYGPTRHEWNLDFPRLMQRAVAMRRANGHMGARERRANRTMGRAGLVGAAATTWAPLANRLIGARPGSFVRKTVAAVTGVSAVRLLPSYARQRFSTWFRTRPKVTLRRRQGAVTVFPTCLVEYQDPQIGKDLVHVYERNGIECSTSAAGCCGAPWLHGGDIAEFMRIATRNVRILADEVGAGTDLVVPQPTCGHVVKSEYVHHVGGADAELVAAHTYDAAEYLMKVHTGDDTLLDTHFDGAVPATVTYHAPCHVRAQDVGLPSRDLLKLTGARVRVVQQCSGIDGTWGLRAGNEEIAVPVAEKLGAMVVEADGEVVTGDCHLANTAIEEQTGARVTHPIQLIARAYGIPVGID